MGELKIREIYNGWIVTDKEGEDWAFTDDNGEYLLHWLSENLGIVPSPQDTDSTETVEEARTAGERLIDAAKQARELVQPMADLSGEDAGEFMGIKYTVGDLPDGVSVEMSNGVDKVILTE